MDDMTPEDQDILTLQEIARYLKLPEDSVLQMAQDGELPATRLASQWRFMRSVIDDWLIGQMREAPRDRLVRLIESGDVTVPLSRLTSVDLMNLDIRPGRKQEVLDQLIEPLVRRGLLRDRRAFLEMLLAREDMVSTGLEHGVALPHLREPEQCPIREPLVVVGLCRKGTEFDALDGKCTRLFLLACSPSLQAHLKIMARIALMLRTPDTVGRLTAADRPEVVMSVLLEAERHQTLQG